MVVGEFGVRGDLASKVQNDARRRARKRRRTIGLRRVRPQRRANDRPARRQRPPRPPDMQRGNVPVPDGLLPPRVRRDALDGQVNFDEAAGVGHRIYDLRLPIHD